MKRALLALLVGSQAAAWCAPQLAWHWSNPQPAGNNLIKVAFQDTSRGLVVADNGEVSVTSDGGETWKSRGGRIDDDYQIAAAVLGPDTLLSLSGFGKIRRSTDGGATWTVAGSFPEVLVNISPCGNGVVLAVGMGGGIVRSADRGASWTEVAPGFDGPFLLGVQCSGDHAFAVGDSGVVLKSRDQGQHWERLPSPFPGFLTGVAFADSTHGIVTTDRGRIAETRDGGRTWKVSILDTLTILLGAERQDARWRVTGTAGGIWTSRDDASTWERSASVPPFDLASAAFLGETGGIAVGNNGLILKETGRGEAWKPIRKGSTQYLDGIAMIDAANWVAFGSPGVILKSADAGATWREVPLQPDSLRFLAGAFRGKRGLLAGDEGTILLSEDAGETWKEARTPRKGLRLFGVAWSDAKSAVAVGDSAALWRTVDGGGSWAELPHPPDLVSQTLSAVAFQPDGMGLAVGYEGMLLRTADGGASWSQVPSPVTDNLYNLAYRDGSTVMAVGSHGVALLTRDGGATWARRAFGERADDIFSMTWLGGDTALAVGDFGHGWFLSLTADAGVSWTKLSKPTRKRLWAMAPLGSGQAALMGQDGAIMMGGLTDRLSGKPVPPPATPGAFSVRRSDAPGHIDFQVTLASNQSITLTEYSLAGHVFETLYRGNLGPGAHSLRLRYSRRGPVIFRLQAAGPGSRFSRSRMLPF